MAFSVVTDLTHSPGITTDTVIAYAAYYIDCGAGGHTFMYPNRSVEEMGAATRPIFGVLWDVEWPELLVWSPR